MMSSSRLVKEDSFDDDVSVMTAATTGSKGGFSVEAMTIEQQNLKCKVRNFVS
jgi:hypothetical protein